MSIALGPHRPSPHNLNVHLLNDEEMKSPFFRLIYSIEGDSSLQRMVSLKEGTKDLGLLQLSKIF